MFRYQLTDFREEIVRNIHRCCGMIDSSLVLLKCLAFILPFIVGEYPLNFFVIPSRWKFVLAHRCFPLRVR